jgi:hypothetical protein
VKVSKVIRTYSKLPVTDLLNKGQGEQGQVSNGVKSLVKSLFLTLGKETVLFRRRGCGVIGSTVYRVT